MTKFSEKFGLSPILKHKHAWHARAIFLAGWVEGTVRLLNVIIFVTEEYNFQKTKISQNDRKKPNLTELTQISCDLLSLFSK